MVLAHRSTHSRHAGDGMRLDLGRHGTVSEVLDVEGIHTSL
jgi:hypothetical protein